MSFRFPDHLGWSWCLWVAIGVTLCGSGCGDDKPRSPKAGTSTPADNGGDNPAGKNPPKKLEITEAALDKILTAQKDQMGKVLLVYVWGDGEKSGDTLKKLEAFRQKQKASELHCMTVAFRGDKASTTKLLEKLNVYCETFVLTDSLAKLQEAWGFGKPPAFVLFDKEGKPTRFTGEEIEWAKIEAEVEKLLGK